MNDWYKRMFINSDITTSAVTYCNCELRTALRFLTSRSSAWNIRLRSRANGAFKTDGQKVQTLLCILFASLLSITNAGIITKSNTIEDKAAGNLITGDDRISEIFGRMIRVQRSVAEYHHNHGFRRHRGKHRKNPAKPVTQCPPPMKGLPDDACTVDPCESDYECQGHGASCCYNGCIFSCAHSWKPPPIIDWQTITAKYESLPTDEYDGNLEFDILPGEMLAESHRGLTLGEICSTTIDEGDILLDCPHGYLCHVENKGNPALGIPDRGRCVAITEDLPENRQTEDDYSY